MPILMAILAVVGGAIWFWVRSNPREAFDVAADAATTLKNAPRRIAFRRQTKSHPVEGIDDPRIAVAAIAQSFIELEDLPTKDQQQKLHFLLRTQLRCDEEEAQEMQVLGRWLQGQCHDAKSAIPRLGRRLRKLNGDQSWETLQKVLGELVDGDLSQSQISAIEDLNIAIKPGR